MYLKQQTELVFGMAIAAVAFLVYANSLGNGFVWDDDVVILGNAALKGNPFSLFYGIDVARVTELNPYYRPLALLSFLIEERLHGLSPVGVRLFNVLLHTANAFLVYRLACSVIKDNKYAALLAGLLFAVHPIQSEGVDFNAGGRNTMLAAFFILAAYLIHERCSRQEKTAGAFIGSALFLCGLFSKEIAVAALPFIAALEVAPLRGADPLRRNRAIFRLLPYAVCLAMYLVLRSNALSSAGVQLDIFSGLGTRLLDNLYIIPRYFLNVVWPFNLSAKYFLPEDFHLLALPLAATWLLLATLLAWLLTRGRSGVTLFGLAWMVAFWLPVSGIFPIPSAPLADRYLYLPAIGLWLIIADLGVRAVQARARFWRYVFLAVLVMLAGVTVRRNMDWKNDISLFSQVIEQYPERAWGYHNLGCAYLDKVKNLDLAERAFEKALNLDPYFPRLRTQMGYARLMRGDFQGALLHYAEAIRINPNDGEAHLNRAIALEYLGEYNDALIEYRRFLEIPGEEITGSRKMAREKLSGLSLLIK